MDSISAPIPTPHILTPGHTPDPRPYIDTLREILSRGLPLGYEDRRDEFIIHFVATSGLSERDVREGLETALSRTPDISEGASAILYVLPIDAQRYVVPFANCLHSKVRGIPDPSYFGVIIRGYNQRLTPKNPSCFVRIHTYKALKRAFSELPAHFASRGHRDIQFIHSSVLRSSDDDYAGYARTYGENLPSKMVPPLDVMLDYDIDLAVLEYGEWALEKLERLFNKQSRAIKTGQHG